MDAELEKLAQTVVRIVDSQDPDAYMLMFEAHQRIGDAYLRERFIELREVRFRELSTGPRLVIVRDILLEVKRAAPSVYEELQAIAEAFAEDEEARAAVGGRTPAPVPSGSSASFTRATSNSVLDGAFHAPVVQAGTFSGGVHTYYAQPPYSALPPVADWSRLGAVDPITLGVHRTRRLPGESPLPPYVERDCEAELGSRIREAARDGGLIVVTGAPFSGKTRTAWEALAASLPAATRVFAPSPGTDLRGLPAVLRGRGEAGCVLWLDALGGHLGEHGLTSALLADLVRLRVPVLATMNDKAYDDRRFGASGRAGVLSWGEPVGLQRVWSKGELERLDSFAGDPRLGAAVVRRGACTVPEYLAVGPELMEEWRRARRPDAHPRGHLLVRVAIDLARCGVSRVSRRPLSIAQSLYPEESAMAEAESFEEALAWATDIRHEVTGLLSPVPGERPTTWAVFGSLVADAEGRPDTPPVSIGMWRFAFIAAPDTAERRTVMRRAHEALAPLADSDPKIPVLLGYINAVMADIETAMQWYRKAADAGHAEAAAAVGEMLAVGDEAAEAIPYLKTAAEAGIVHAQYRLAMVLAAQAENWLNQAAEAGYPAATQALPAFRTVAALPLLAPRPEQLVPSTVMSEEYFLPPDADTPAGPGPLSRSTPDTVEE
ncbi:SEL1-like repeat protein [Streptomyces bacillaris]|uniref:sel1 repeat family protein n=1 Tax=Streptomyces bacillaris TaxID=68179 RepID=UPI0036FB0DCF